MTEDAAYLRRRADPVAYERMLALNREWHRTNRDRARERHRGWRTPEVKAHLAAYQRALRAKAGGIPRSLRPEYDCIAGARNANNRARRGGQTGRVTTAEVRVVMAAGVCAWCGSSAQPTLDHIVPLSRGGSNVKDNLQRLCLPCNSGKRDTAPQEVAA
jgi:5-methylcytosine-specific restriction endonuclease McrA